LDCPACYNLVQDAANSHREKLANLNKTLNDIYSRPTVIDDGEFLKKLNDVQEKINILADDAKAGAGGDGRTLNEVVEELETRLDAVKTALDQFDLEQVGK
jgi:coxsackievirus/adenovirus receptor